MLAALIFSVSLPARAEGQDLATHFSGKTVNIVVGSAPGGGYDTYARLVARFVGKYLPGKPAAFLVQNMPGGGGLRGVAATMKARPDGLTIGMLHPRIIIQELFGKDIPDFDLGTARFLGSFAGGAKRQFLVCVRRDITTSWEEVLKLGRPIKGGGSAPGDFVGLATSFVEHIGGPIKVVYGYGGVSEVEAAFDRGELDYTNRCNEDYVFVRYPHWLEKKMLAPLFWWADRPSEAWLRRIGAPMPPYLFDVLKATEDQKKAFKVAVGLVGSMTIGFVMPAAVSDDTYKAWRRAFEATARDSDFIKAAEVAMMPVGMATPEDYERTFRAFRELSPDSRALLKKMVLR